MSVELGVEIDCLETHAIKVLDKPCQILALQVRNAVSVIVSAKEVGELFVELRRGFVEVAQLL